MLSGPVYTKDNTIDSVPTQYPCVSIVELTSGFAEMPKIIVAVYEVHDVCVSAIFRSTYQFIFRGACLSCDDSVRGVRT
jgi:hypothetical protein